MVWDMPGGGAAKTKRAKRPDGIQIEAVVAWDAA
jgi:hypothetical protein